MKKKSVFILIILLAVGFASVSTALVLNGTLNIGFNTNNFESSIVYTRAETTDGTATINQDEKNIDFETIKLENINQQAILEFDVTNKSREYDASVTINCGLKDTFTSFSEYLNVSIDVESPFRLNSSETKTGHLTVEMIKPYVLDDTEIEVSCELVASPIERDTLGDEYKYVYKDKILNGADPVIKGELIPVKIAESGEVTYANTSKEWYNYGNKEWANAVILIDNPSKHYKENDIIPELDIESYFVWIPRYKYQIFDEGNYTTAIEGKPTEDTIAKEIKIEFESKEIAPSTGNKKDEWLTHPAFTNFDVSGLWVGKFETGYKGATSTASAQVNENDASKVMIKPNVYSWRGITVSNIFKTAYNYNRELDSHMIKNTEWGAVAYLSHSKYGINREVRINNNSAYITGNAAIDSTDQSSYPGVSGTDASKTLPYNTEMGYKASTTGNITGIYDMSGGAWEYVAAYVPSNQDRSGFTSIELSTYAKYLDVYSNSSSTNSYNNRILGDATGELGPFYHYADKDSVNKYHNNWYADYSYFAESTDPWFNRGGYYGDGVLAGQFHFNRLTGATYTNDGFRLVLTPII